MIQKKTVLILGAGASQPYGYPLGLDLVQKIVHHTGQAGGLHGLLSPVYGAQLDDLHSRLRDSHTSSIDEFLESNGEHVELGKLCIAAALTVWGPTHDQKSPAELDWYRYIWERLRQGAATADQFCENQLRVITYNYDQSFERYLAAVLRQMYPTLARSGAEEARAVQEKAVPVVHVHGRLDDGEVLRIGAGSRMPLIELSFFQRVAADLRIVHDEKPTEEYSRAHAWIREADEICFLGFGYHPTNVKRLDVRRQIGPRRNKVWFGGSAYRLEDGEIHRAQGLIGLSPSRTTPFLKPVDSLMYLRRHARLE